MRKSILKLAVYMKSGISREEKRNKLKNRKTSTTSIQSTFTIV